MGFALQKLAQEDPSPCSQWTKRPPRLLLLEWGELHPEIIVDRLMREFKVEANVGKPEVVFRENDSPGLRLNRSTSLADRWSRQYGHVVMTVEPSEPGKGLETRQ